MVRERQDDGTLAVVEVAELDRLAGVIAERRVERELPVEVLGHADVRELRRHARDLRAGDARQSTRNSTTSTTSRQHRQRSAPSGALVDSCRA